MNALISSYSALVELIQADPFAQLVGLIALAIGASAFIQKDDRLLRRNLTLYTIVMGIHFFMLGVTTAALMAWMGSFRTYLSTRTKNVWVMLSLLIIVLVVTLPGAKSAVQFLPIIGTTLGTWALFREQGLRMRIMMFCGTLCWVSHNFLVGSIGGTIIEASFLMINARTMLLLLREKKIKIKVDNS